MGKMTNPFLNPTWIVELHRKKHNEIFDFKDFLERSHRATAKVREDLEHHINNYKVSFGLEALDSRFDDGPRMDKRGFVDVIFYGQNTDYGLAFRLCNDRLLYIGVLIYDRTEKAWSDLPSLGKTTDLVICGHDQTEIAKYRVKDDAIAIMYSNFVERLTMPKNAWQYARRNGSNNHGFYAKLKPEETAVIPSHKELILNIA